MKHQITGSALPVWSHGRSEGHVFYLFPHFQEKKRDDMF